MAKQTLRFEGGAALLANLNSLSHRLSRQIQIEALKEVGEPMRKQMARRAPHAPGEPDLRNAMTISTSRGQDAKEAAVAVGPTREGFYGSFQEFGTKQFAAQPFARPAFDETVQSTLNALGDVLWRELAGRGLQRPMASVDVPVLGEEV